MAAAGSKQGSRGDLPAHRLLQQTESLASSAAPEFVKMILLDDSDGSYLDKLQEVSVLTPEMDSALKSLSGADSDSNPTTVLGCLLQTLFKHADNMPFTAKTRYAFMKSYVHTKLYLDLMAVGSSLHNEPHRQVSLLDDPRFQAYMRRMESETSMFRHVHQCLARKALGLQSFDDLTLFFAVENNYASSNPEVFKETVKKTKEELSDPTADDAVDQLENLYSAQTSRLDQSLSYQVYTLSELPAPMYSKVADHAKLHGFCSKMIKRAMLTGDPDNYRQAWLTVTNVLLATREKKARVLGAITKGEEWQWTVSEISAAEKQRKQQQQQADTPVGSNDDTPVLPLPRRNTTFWEAPLILGDLKYTSKTQIYNHMYLDKQDALGNCLPVIHPTLYLLLTTALHVDWTCLVHDRPMDLNEFGATDASNGIPMENRENWRNSSRAERVPECRWWCCFTGAPIETPLHGLYLIFFFAQIPPVVLTVSFDYWTTMDNRIIDRATASVVANSENLDSINYQGTGAATNEERYISSGQFPLAHQYLRKYVGVRKRALSKFQTVCRQLIARSKETSRNLFTPIAVRDQLKDLPAERLVMAELEQIYGISETDTFETMLELTGVSTKESDLGIPPTNDEEEQAPVDADPMQVDQVPAEGGDKKGKKDSQSTPASKKKRASHASKSAAAVRESSGKPKTKGGDAGAGSREAPPQLPSRSRSAIKEALVKLVTRHQERTDTMDLSDLGGAPGSGEPGDWMNVDNFPTAPPTEDRTTVAGEPAGDASGVVAVEAQKSPSEQETADKKNKKKKDTESEKSKKNDDEEDKKKSKEKKKKSKKSKAKSESSSSSSSESVVSSGSSSEDEESEEAVSSMSDSQESSSDRSYRDKKKSKKKSKKSKTKKGLSKSHKKRGSKKKKRVESSESSESESSSSSSSDSAREKSKRKSKKAPKTRKRKAQSSPSSSEDSDDRPTRTPPPKKKAKVSSARVDEGGDDSDSSEVTGDKLKYLSKAEREACANGEDLDDEARSQDGDATGEPPEGYAYQDGGAPHLTTPMFVDMLRHVKGVYVTGKTLGIKKGIAYMPDPMEDYVDTNAKLVFIPNMSLVGAAVGELVKSYVETTSKYQPEQAKLIRTRLTDVLRIATDVDHEQNKSFMYPITVEKNPKVNSFLAFADLRTVLSLMFMSEAQLKKETGKVDKKRADRGEVKEKTSKSKLIETYWAEVSHHSPAAIEKLGIWPAKDLAPLIAKIIDNDEIVVNSKLCQFIVNKEKEVLAGTTPRNEAIAQIKQKINPHAGRYLGVMFEPQKKHQKEKKAEGKSKKKE